MAEAERARLRLERLERIRMHVAQHGQMVHGRCEVLADREHVYVMCAHVAHDVDDLFVRFAETHHHSALGGYLREPPLEALQQLQRHMVVRSRTRLLVQPRHRLEVVVHHIGGCLGEDLERALGATAEVGRENLDARLRRLLAHLTDAIHEVTRTAIAKIIAVDAGDHHVLQFQSRDRGRQVVRFVGVEWVRTAMSDIAKRAASRALVTHDHERGRAVTEALADVRARGLLAHRMQAVLTQDLLDLVETRGRRSCLHADPFGLLQRWRRHHLDRDARRLGPGLLLGCRVVVFERGIGGHGHAQFRQSAASTAVRRATRPRCPRLHRHRV